jgi:hypothetical protein
VSEVEDLEAEIRETERYLNEAIAEHRSKEAALEDAEAEVDEVQRDLNAQREALRAARRKEASERRD